MAIVVIGLICLCGYIWYKTRPYRKLRDAKGDLNDAVVTKEVEEVRAEIIKIKETTDELV